MKICNITIAISLLCTIHSCFGMNDSRQNYIDRYKQLAITEMNRTGIPASIKLAQGLLESGAGKSVLATKANNHFGIKCGGSWEGDTYYREDDDYNKKGQLIQSCFRKFDSVYDSYFAHSAFLTDQKRYAFLFQLDKNDYKEWAKGLRKAGYATDKKYAHKLIKIIEDYKLYELDQEQSLFASNHKKLNSQTNISKTTKTIPSTKEEVIVFEESSTTTAKQRNRKRSTRERTSKKRRNNRRYVNHDADYHIVNNGQSLKDIARMYRINETSLRIRNRLPKDAIVNDGQKLNLRKKVSIFNRPSFTRVADSKKINPQEEFIF